MDRDLPGRAGASREFVVQADARVDAALAAAEPGLSRARAQRLIDAGLVTVGGEPVRKSARLAAGTTVSFTVPEEEPAPSGPTGLEIPVLYENATLVAIDKPAGLAVHGGPGDRSLTVVDWFCEHFPKEAGKLGGERPGIVHRLDKDTTGVLLLAKDAASQAGLSAAFEHREVHKTYLALCDGVPSREHAFIDAPVGRHPGDRTRMAIVGRGRAARTEYRVLGSDHGTSLIEAKPETGRTHQIRVHLSAVGAPIVGDNVYGKSSAPRQMLHAWRIDLPFGDGRRLEITAPLPSDFVETVRSLGLEHLALPYTHHVAPALRTAE